MTLTPEQLGRHVADELVRTAVGVALAGMDVTRPPDASRLQPRDAAFLAAKRAELEWWGRQVERRSKVESEGADRLRPGPDPMIPPEKYSPTHANHLLAPVTTQTGRVATIGTPP